MFLQLAAAHSFCCLSNIPLSIICATSFLHDGCARLLAFLLPESLLSQYMVQTFCARGKACHLPFALGTRLFSSLSAELERILALRVAAPSAVQGVEKHVLLSICPCTCVCCCYGFSGESDWRVCVCVCVCVCVHAHAHVCEFKRTIWEAPERFLRRGCRAAGCGINVGLHKFTK